jgi:5'-nucleotidase / UDP-sugar diphosphatase
MGLRHKIGRCGMRAVARPRIAALAIVGAALGLAAAEPGCTSGGTGPQTPCPPGQTCQVRLTLLHTSDIHSRIFPYDLQILQVDSELGLGTIDEVKNVGGVARQSYVVNRERARADRVLHLDSGDIFEGAPIFNYFNGEPETRAESMMGTDAMAIGNHEFDDGAVNAVRQLQKWADFPVLAANYSFPSQGTAFDRGLDTIVKPFTTFNLEGLKVAVIGMGNFTSLGSVFQQPNSLGIQTLNTVETAQGWVDLLRPYVDVIVVLSHLGLTVDEDMVQNTTGIDVVEGGHNHIVINPPQVLQDCSADPNNPGFVWAVNPNCANGTQLAFNGQPCQSNQYPKGLNPSSNNCQVCSPDNPYYDPLDTAQQHPNEFARFCHPRNVIISHSGAFSKYVGRFELMLSNDPKLASPTGNPKDYDPVDGFEVISHDYVPIPIDDSLPDDPNIDNLLLPYQRALDYVPDLAIVAGYSPNGALRTAPQGGDSPLGNLISDAMWLRLGIQTDFSMTNTTGLRTDMIPGPVTVEEMYNIFPFNNTITKMQLSGTEVQQMFDFIAGRSQGRGCESQAQIAGSRVTLNCGGCVPTGRANMCNNGGKSYQVFGNCPPGATTEGAGSTGAPCVHDDECIGAAPGTCVDSSGNTCEPGASCTCDVTACAEQLYIGHLSNCPNGNVACTCAKDTDCPDKLQGQCDTSGGQSSTGTCLAPVQLENVYDFATSNYLAAGGSGFRVLQRNTTQHDSGIEQRDAAIDMIRNAPPCGYSSAYGTQEGLFPCSTDSDCANGPPGSAYVCACPGQVTATGTDVAQTCQTAGSCDPSVGRCILAQCRNDMATFHEQSCVGSPNTTQCDTDLDSCSLGGEECKILSCVDTNVGAVSDGRIPMVGR